MKTVLYSSAPVNISRSRLMAEGTLPASRARTDGTSDALSGAASAPCAGQVAERLAVQARSRQLRALADTPGERSRHAHRRARAGRRITSSARRTATWTPLRSPTRRRPPRRRFCCANLTTTEDFEKDISDPIGGSYEVYLNCRDQIEQGIASLFRFIDQGETAVPATPAIAGTVARLRWEPTMAGLS